MNNFQILLYYKYVTIENPTEIRDWQYNLCKELGLKCRIIVAHEGINGTLEGTVENTEKYIEAMNAHPLFANIHWKKSVGTGNAFPRYSVKVRKEIVALHLGDKDFDPNETTGNHLKPEELKKWYEENKEFYIVDMRNDYELEVGKFENTIFPGLENFRDLREKVDDIKHLKDKTVLTVCTGGIRCEKASGFLVKEGFNDVHQLDGGMVSYMEKYPGQNFKGSLYVFDGRVCMNFNDKDSHEIIGRCHSCKKSSETYRNCCYKWCNKPMILCDDCKDVKIYCKRSCRILDIISRIPIIGKWINIKLS